ncbi:MAG: endonuclease/exonuclease/phosphatase family protein [Bacteroidetes bacterium]|nr:endonuclease/exonuclease/phosphatase family protein [Bacteroidota bacterium]
MNVTRHLSLVTLFLSLVTLFSCSTSSFDTTQFVTIGTFNMEWLGDGVGDTKKRTDADYLRIADIIEKTGADVIGIQEVENEAALKKVLRYLDGWKGVVGTTAREQNVGVLWRSSVSVNVEGEYMPVAIVPGRNRPGFVVNCTKGDLSWKMMVVHLKSTSRYDSTSEMREESRRVRAHQVDVITAWSDSLLNVAMEQNVMVVGDFNDFPQRANSPTLTSLVQSSNMKFVTDGVKSCKEKNFVTIDHVVVSPSILQRLIKGTERTENFRAFLSAEDADMVSDHCPVIVRFSTALPRAN